MLVVVPSADGSSTGSSGHPTRIPAALVERCTDRNGVRRSFPRRVRSPSPSFLDGGFWGWSGGGLCPVSRILTLAETHPPLARKLGLHGMTRRTSWYLRGGRRGGGVVREADDDLPRLLRPHNAWTSGSVRHGSGECQHSCAWHSHSGDHPGMPSLTRGGARTRERQERSRPNPGARCPPSG